MKKIVKKGIVTLAISIVTVVGVGSLANAIDENTTPPTSGNDTATLRAERAEKAEQKIAEHKEKQKERLKARCELHKTHLDKLVNNIQTRSQRVYDRITKIAELIKEFYAKKELDSEQYDALVADVEAKRADAKQKLDTLLTHSEISCSADSPRALIKDFRNDRKSKIEAMKAYRQAVLKLLQNVRQAAIDQHSSRLDAKKERN